MTIQVQQLPVAVNDSYIAELNVSLVVTTGDPDDLLDNDTLGYPPATIVSFGIGDAPANPADGVTSVSLAGGTLTVAADGSFTLTTSTQSGSFNFDYRLENAAITNNTITNTTNSDAFGGFAMDAGATSTDTMTVCVDARANSFAGTAGSIGGGTDFFIGFTASAPMGTTLILPGYAGPQRTTTASSRSSRVKMWVRQLAPLSPDTNGVLGTGTSCP